MQRAAGQQGDKVTLAQRHLSVTLPNQRRERRRRRRWEAQQVSTAWSNFKGWHSPAEYRSKIPDKNPLKPPRGIPTTPTWQRSVPCGDSYKFLTKSSMDYWFTCNKDAGKARICVCNRKLTILMMATHVQMCRFKAFICFILL